jgi:hypothetical protein
MELKSAAKSILVSSLALKEAEKFLVVTDPDRRRIGEALFEAGPSSAQKPRWPLCFPERPTARNRPDTWRTPWRPPTW